MRATRLALFVTVSLALVLSGCATSGSREVAQLRDENSRLVQQRDELNRKLAAATEELVITKTAVARIKDQVQNYNTRLTRAEAMEQIGRRLAASETHEAAAVEATNNILVRALVARLAKLQNELYTMRGPDYGNQQRPGATNPFRGGKTLKSNQYQQQSQQQYQQRNAKHTTSEARARFDTGSAGNK